MRARFTKAAIYCQFVKVLAVLPILLAMQVFAEDPRVTSFIQQGDLAEKQGKPRAALVSLRAAEAIEPQNVGVLLRISKQYGDLIDVTKPEDNAKRIADLALDYGNRALEVDPKNAKAHLNLAVSYGHLTDFVGNKTKLEYSKIIHDETVKSIELDPTDDFAWHVLGRWEAGVANVNGVLKALASLVYGGMPKASNEEAVKCFKKALEIAPQRIMHHGELAHVYKQMGKNDLALQEWQNTLGIRAQDSDDENYQKEGRAALEAARKARGSDGGKFTSQR
jgi:tetratricopeptide (TPR) repeat protein